MNEKYINLIQLLKHSINYNYFALRFIIAINLIKNEEKTYSALFELTVCWEKFLTFSLT